MGKLYDTINDRLRDFIQRQHMFFVATAPSSLDGRVNLSPKGLDSLRIVDEHCIAYADLSGSGIETVAHLKDNGRIVLMFCAFEDPPKIVRIHGRGEVIEPSQADFEPLRQLFPDHFGLRAVIRIACTRISDSCGFGVPLYQFQGQREQLSEWAERKGPEGIADYQRRKNAHSIDGLLGLAPPTEPDAS